jgi:hypothetical protein
MRLSGQYGDGLVIPRPEGAAGCLQEHSLLHCLTSKKDAVTLP